jgi:hypothetical protein
MIVIAIISNPRKMSGKLTRFFTGSPAYHIGFVDTEAGKFYDQNLLFRRRLWPHYADQHVKLYQCPVLLSRDDLEHQLDTRTDWYGVMDYLFFGLRKLIPTATHSFKGAICSEVVDDILKAHGWKSPFENVPSPADFEGVLVPL